MRLSYFFKQFLFYFAISLAVLFFLFSIDNIIELFSIVGNQNIAFYKIFPLVVYILPFLFSFILPIAGMTGIACAVFSIGIKFPETLRKKRNNWKSKIFISSVFLALIMMVGILLHFQFTLPWGNKNYVSAKYELLAHRPDQELIRNKVYSQGEFEIRIGDHEQNLLSNVRLVDFKENLIYISEQAIIGKEVPSADDPSKSEIPVLLIRPFIFPYVFSMPHKELSVKNMEYKLVHLNLLNLLKIAPKGAELDSLSDVFLHIRNNAMSKILEEIKGFHQLLSLKHELGKISQWREDNSSQEEWTEYREMLEEDIQNQEKQMGEIRKDIYSPNDIYILQKKLYLIAGAFFLGLIGFFIGALFALKRNFLLNENWFKIVCIFACGIVIHKINLVLNLGANFMWRKNEISSIFAAWGPILFLLLLLVILFFIFKKSITKESFVSNHYPSIDLIEHPGLIRSMGFSGLILGYLSCLLVCVVYFFFISSYFLGENQFIFTLAYTAAFCLSYACWYFIIYQIHRRICLISPQYPVTPLKAVFYHFIPGFNFIWQFIWPYRLMNFLKKKNPYFSLSGEDIGVLFFLYTFPFTFIFPFPFLFYNFIILHHIIRQFRIFTFQLKKEQG